MATYENYYQAYHGSGAFSRACRGQNSTPSRAPLLDANDSTVCWACISASIRQLESDSAQFLQRMPEAAPLVALPINSTTLERPRAVNQANKVNAVGDDASAILAALADIIGPPSGTRSARASLRVVIEALVRARERAVPAGTSSRDAQLAHGRLVALLHRVAQMERGHAR